MYSSLVPISIAAIMRFDSAEASELTIGVSGLRDIYDYFMNPVRHSIKLAKMGKC